VVLDPESLQLALETLQQRIDLLQQSLAQQNKLATLGMVTAVIAHEFNNILTPMISYTRFGLTDKADDALRTKALTKALSGAERLANISKSLLGFARGDESQTAGVLPAVKETLACLARDLTKDGITLQLGVPEDLMVAMNAGHLQQVLMNLIVNARSAMLGNRTGGGIKRLTIGGRVMEASEVRGRKGKWAEIAIADTGPGIPPEVLPRIFEPFFSTKRGGAGVEGGEGGGTEGVGGSMPRGGTGLGLTICQELIRVAGGEIRVVSEVGKGTKFAIELPVAV
jgi:two-component system cell cycle sensor histidine kinase/response regulator CckA